MISIQAVSDLHGNLPEITRQSELLLISGDSCPYENESIYYQKEWFRDKFSPWIKAAPIDMCIMVAGNHDYIFESNSWIWELMKEILYTPSGNKIVYLHNEEYTYYSESGESWKIFGTPFCKMDGNMAFMREEKTLSERYQAIPEGLDILLSHDTPRFLEYSSIRDTDGNYATSSGNYELRLAIERSKPKYTFCGHIHKPSEALDLGCTILQNVSQKEKNKNTNNIIYKEINKL